MSFGSRLVKPFKKAVDFIGKTTGLKKPGVKTGVSQEDLDFATQNTAGPSGPLQGALRDANRSGVGLQNFGGQVLGQGLVGQRQARGGQQNLVGLLQRQAAGTGGPTAAGSLLQLEQDNALRQQLGLAAGARGNPALAQRVAAQNIGQLQQQNIAQAGALRAQEQQAAQGLLGNVLQGQRQQDLGLLQQGFGGIEAGGQLQLDQAGLLSRDEIARQNQRNQLFLGRAGLLTQADQAALAAQGQRFQATLDTITGGRGGGNR